MLKWNLLLNARKTNCFLSLEADFLTLLRIASSSGVVIRSEADWNEDIRERVESDKELGLLLWSFLNSKCGSCSQVEEVREKVYEQKRIFLIVRRR